MPAKSLSGLTLRAETVELRARLEEVEETLRAIRSGEVDTLVVESGAGPQVYTLQGLDAETNRFRGQILAQVSDAVIAVDREGRITYLNAAAERLYGLVASRVLGQSLSTIYSSQWLHPKDEAVAAAALSERGEWRGENVHVTNDGRKLKVESGVTVMREISGRSTGMLAVIRDVTERKQHEDQVAVSEIRYRRLFETAHDGIILLDPGTRKIIDANPFMTKMLGYRRHDLIGKELFEIGLLEDEDASREMFRKLTNTNQVRYENLPLESQGGRHQEVEVVANLYDENGHSVIQCNIRDITERKRSEEHVKLLMAEVNHRAKNLLAVVQAVAHQTAKHGDPATFSERLCDRIAALAVGQDLLVKNQWHGVDVLDLVEAQLSHFRDLIGSRVLIDGPVARLTAAAAQGIGMALHELATNAAKYGALSTPEGRVHIAWTVTAGAAPRFSMSWREEGGPKVIVPTRRGFGQMVIGRMAEAAIQGIADITFREEGLLWILSAATENALVVTGGEAWMSGNMTRLDGPHRARILIVEDEPMLAFTLEELLIEAGFEIAGVAGRLETALALIESGVCDAAIIDANLAGVSASPAATALTARGLPFLVLSGYLPSQQHSAFSAALCLQKPCRPDDLIRSLRSILPAS
ncbi:MAG: PAS domain S-box protein [Azospirillaceae bacterium]|nr:PAS domain S-box protein [Azospirillaceae bacterium]